MRSSHFTTAFPVGAVVLLSIGCGAGAVQEETPSLAGRWDAQVVVNELEIPFPFEIVETDSTLEASFFNGDLEITSTGSSVEDGTLTFRFDQYGAQLAAAYQDGVLEGEYVRGSRAPYPFRATRAAATPAPAPAGDAPSIAGVWRIPTVSRKGEKAWRFIVRQDGANVAGAILRVDGDTGNLMGSYRDGKFVMSHFSGARPMLLEVTVNDDGSLTLEQNRRTTLEAVREDRAAAMGLAEPTDPTTHTTIKDPSEPFRFAFPDLEGNLVTNEDPRFAGKVVLVSIGGSWCPNCHDEAPFLSKLYQTYRSQGLEIVGLSFEDEDQLANPTRLRAFIDRYDLGYTFLLAGVTSELAEKVPQAENLNTFPTSFLLGRDGRVRSVHAGFPSPGSGTFYTETIDAMTAEVEHLLAESVSPTN